MFAAPDFFVLTDPISGCNRKMSPTRSFFDDPSRTPVNRLTGNAILPLRIDDAATFAAISD